MNSLLPFWIIIAPAVYIAVDSFGTRGGKTSTFSRSGATATTAPMRAGTMA